VLVSRKGEAEVYSGRERLESRLAACLCRKALGDTSIHRDAQSGRVWFGGGPLEKRTMPFADTTRSDGAVEECLDELNDLLAGLQHYTPTVLAVALRVHLETLLQALLEGKVCTREEVRDFVKELERDALQYDED
jgi:hypothetical protein